MKQEERYYKDAWYKVDYDVHENHVDFTATKIQAMDENPEESQLEPHSQIKGYLKWDGCMEFQQEEHYCGLYHVEQTYLLMKHIYEFTKSLGGNFAECG